MYVILAWAAAAVVLAAYGAILRQLVEKFFFPEVVRSFWENLRLSFAIASVGLLAYGGIVLRFTARRVMDLDIPTFVIGILLLHSAVMMAFVYWDKKEYDEEIKRGQQIKEVKDLVDSVFDMYKPPAPEYRLSEEDRAEEMKR